jgi:hypothetical protein
MASTYSPLKIELIGTGDQSGTWGATTNTNLGTALEEAITGSADVTFASGTVTLTLTDTNATQTARNLRLNLTGTSGGAQNLIVPAIEKLYLVNNGCADAITVKNSTGTGIAVPASKSMFVFNNGTNVVDAVTYLSSLTLGSALPVASGGTGVTSSAAAPFALKGANSDITSLTGLTTPLSVNQGGTGATTLAGANIPVTNVANSFTGLQTFVGTSSNADLKTSNIIETATVSATAATGTINYDITTQSVLYYTSNASANWTVNFRGSSGTSLNTIMATGESMSVTFLVTNGATAYYNSAVQVDGSSVTPKWQGGTAPTSGNASSIDSYTYVIIKTGSAAFTVLAAQTKFA